MPKEVDPAVTTQGRSLAEQREVLDAVSEITITPGQVADLRLASRLYRATAEKRPIAKRNFINASVPPEMTAIGTLLIRSANGGYVNPEKLQAARASASSIVETKGS